MWNISANSSRYKLILLFSNIPVIVIRAKSFQLRAHEIMHEGPEIVMPSCLALLQISKKSNLKSTFFSSCQLSCFAMDRFRYTEYVLNVFLLVRAKKHIYKKLYKYFKKHISNERCMKFTYACGYLE